LNLICLKHRRLRIEPEYYGRFGFKADPRLVLENVPAEYFQVLAFSKTIPTGSVV
jgi:predicted N-acetyltransferase YhbS